MGTFTTTLNLKDAALREELIRRAEKLEARLQELANGAEGVAWPEGTARDTARFYAKQIGLLDVEVAQEVLRVLVDEGEATSAAFWGTPLGRALFLLGAYPDQVMDRTHARHVLGLRSRQHVHNLIVAGEIHEDMGGMISVDELRDLFRVP